MGKARKWAHLIGAGATLAACVLAYESVYVLNYQNYERLQAAQDMRVGALETSSNAGRRLVRADFWASGTQYPTDDFFAIDKATGRSIAVSPLTGEIVNISVQGLGDEPEWTMKVGYRGEYIYRVGRRHVIDGKEYEFFAQTDLIPAYKAAWKLLTMHVLSILTTLLLYWFAIKLIGKNKSPALRKLMDDDGNVLSGVFKELPLGCIVLNRDCFIKQVNDALCADFGYRPSELIGCHVDKLLPHIHRDGHEAKVKELIDGSRPATGWRNVVGLHKDGAEVKIKLSVKSLRQRCFDGSNMVYGLGMTEVRK